MTDAQLAAQINVSVSWLQHDRIGKQLIPFYRIGGLVRYNRESVLLALQANEEGGMQTRRKPK